MEKGERLVNLTYFTMNEDESYKALYDYKKGTIDPSEIYARQLCEYAVLHGVQYRLLSNEMEEDTDMLIVEEVGKAKPLQDEKTYKDGITIEFREYRSEYDMPILYKLTMNPYDNPHFKAMRYLLKDYVHIPTVGIRKRDSAEIDEDRACYVIYVTTDTY